MNNRRITAVPLALGLLLSFAACSGDDEKGPAEKESATTAAPAPEGESDKDDGEGDGAKGDDPLGEALEDRDLVLQALESALSKDNAKGNWDDDTLTMTLDGDVDNLMDKFPHCRQVGNFLEEGDTLILEYPNGSVDCADIPELEGQLIW